MSNQQNEQEKQWREEFESAFTDNLKSYGVVFRRTILPQTVRDLMLETYLAARKNAQADIDFWKEEYISHSETMLKAQGEVEKLKAENERLKKFCNEFVYGEENPKYYSTMDEKIQKRDKLLEQAKPWIRNIFYERKYSQIQTEVLWWLKQCEELK